MRCDNCREGRSRAGPSRTFALRGVAMLWRGRRQSDNIEDERSDSGGGLGGGPGQFRFPIGGRAGGGSSVILVILVVLAGWYFGFDPSQILGDGSGGFVPGGGGQITDNSGARDSTGAPASDE